jgi:hypothetical protein
MKSTSVVIAVALAGIFGSKVFAVTGITKITSNPQGGWAR